MKGAEYVTRGLSASEIDSDRANDMICFIYRGRQGCPAVEAVTDDYFFFWKYISVLWRSQLLHYPTGRVRIMVQEYTY